MDLGAAGVEEPTRVSTEIDENVARHRTHKKFTEFLGNVFIKRRGSTPAVARRELSLEHPAAGLTKTHSSSSNRSSRSVSSSRRSSTSSVLLESGRHSWTLKTSSPGDHASDFSTFEDTENVEEPPIASHTTQLSPPFASAACSSLPLELMPNRLSYSLPSFSHASSPLTRSPSPPSLFPATSVLSTPSNNRRTIRTAPSSNSSRRDFSKSGSSTKRSKHRRSTSSEGVVTRSQSKSTSSPISVTPTLHNSMRNSDPSLKHSLSSSSLSYPPAVPNRHPQTSTLPLSSLASPSNADSPKFSRKRSYSSNSLPSPITVRKARSWRVRPRPARTELPSRTSWRERFARVRAASATPTTTSTPSSSRHTSPSPSRKDKKTSSLSSATTKKNSAALRIKRRFTATKPEPASSKDVMKIEREHVSWMGIDDVPDGDTEPVRTSSDSEDASSSSSSKKRRSRKNSRGGSLDDEQADPRLDYLGVRNDLNLKGLFTSIGFGAERVQYSDHVNLVIISDKKARSPASPTTTTGRTGTGTGTSTGTTISKSSKSISLTSYTSSGTTKKFNSLPTRTLSLLTGGGGGGGGGQHSSSSSTTAADGGSTANGDSGGPVLPRAEEYAVVVTNQALYLFAPQIESGRVRHLICNCYVRIKLSEILGISLPYRSRDSTGGQEYALRSDEFALHLVGRVTLWLEAYPGKRSEFAESISTVYEKLLAQELPMEHPARDDLVRSCVNDKVWSHVLESGDVVWAKSPILKQGWLYHQVFAPDDPTKTEWRKRWCALSVGQIRYFNNPEEMEALRFLLRSPKNKRANLPAMSRDDEITLGLYHLYKISFTPEEGVTDYGFEIANVDFRDTHKDSDLVDVESRSLARMQRFRHVFRCTSREEATQWILAVQTRFSTQQRRVRRMKLKAQLAFEEELKSLRLQEAELLAAAQKKQGVGTKSAPSSSDGKHVNVNGVHGVGRNQAQARQTLVRRAHMSKKKNSVDLDLQNADPQMQRNVSLSNGRRPPRKETEADLDHPTHRRSTSSPVSLISRVFSPLSFTERSVNDAAQAPCASDSTLQASASQPDELSKHVPVSTKRQGPSLHRSASATDAHDVQPRKFSSPQEELDPFQFASKRQTQRRRRSSREFDSLPFHKCDSGADLDFATSELGLEADVSVSGVQKSFHSRNKSSSSAAGANKCSKSESTVPSSPPRSLTTHSRR